MLEPHYFDPQRVKSQIQVPRHLKSDVRSGCAMILRILIQRYILADCAIGWINGSRRLVGMSEVDLGRRGSCSLGQRGHLEVVVLRCVQCTSTLTVRFLPLVNYTKA